MSDITGTDHGEPFKMRVVSGMLIGGSIVISWATGRYASSQIDWGFDSSVPNKTEIPLLQPGDRGYNPQKDTPRRVRYHRELFPEIRLDTRHYFRVRSETRTGRIGQSPVYMVIVPSDIQMSMKDGLRTEVELELVVVSEKTVDSNSPEVQLAGINTDPMSSDQATAIEAGVTEPAPLDEEIEQTSTGDNLSTNINYTITQ